MLVGYQWHFLRKCIRFFVSSEQFFAPCWLVTLRRTVASVPFHIHGRQKSCSAENELPSFTAKGKHFVKKEHPPFRDAASDPLWVEVRRETSTKLPSLTCNNIQTISRKMLEVSNLSAVIVVMSSFSEFSYRKMQCRLVSLRFYCMNA